MSHVTFPSEGSPIYFYAYPSSLSATRYFFHFNSCLAYFMPSEQYWKGHSLQHTQVQTVTAEGFYVPNYLLVLVPLTASTRCSWAPTASQTSNSSSPAALWVFQEELSVIWMIYHSYSLLSPTEKLCQTQVPALTTHYKAAPSAIPLMPLILLHFQTLTPSW